MVDAHRLLVTTLPRVPREEHSPLCAWWSPLDRSDPTAPCICGAWNDLTASPRAVTAGVSLANERAGEAPATSASDDK